MVPMEGQQPRLWRWPNAQTLVFLSAHLSVLQQVGSCVYIVLCSYYTVCGHWNSNKY